MTPFFAPDFQALDLFGPVHWTIIATLVVLGRLILSNGLQATRKGRDRIRAGIITVLLACFVWRYLWRLQVGVWTIQGDLPLHICSAMVLVTVWGLWTRATWAMRLMYFFGIAGSMQGVLTPQAQFGTLHFAFFETVFTHGLLVISGMWVVLIEEYRPQAVDAVKAFMALNVYAALIYFVNMGLGANYLWLMDKPITGSLLDFFPGWPWYILMMDAGAIISFVVLLLPFSARGQNLSETITTRWAGWQ